MNIVNNPDECVSYLLSDSIGVVPTDTIYGISCLAFSENKVEEIYNIKGRDKDKPFIILLSDYSDLDLFQIFPSEEQKMILDTYWPGPYSIVLDCEDSDLKYLHRGTNSLAFRIPQPSYIRDILDKTGPLVSTSANLSQQPTVTSLDRLPTELETNLDFFYDIGDLNNQPSNVLKIEGGNVLFLR